MMMEKKETTPSPAQSQALEWLKKDVGKKPLPTSPGHFVVNFPLIPLAPSVAPSLAVAAAAAAAAAFAAATTEKRPRPADRPQQPRSAQ